MNVYELIPGDIETQAENWFALTQDAACRSECQSAFEQWLGADPRHVQAYRRVQALWQQLDEVMQLPEVLGLEEASPARQADSTAAASNWEQLKFRPTPKPVPRRRDLWRSAIVAGVMLSIGVGAFAWLQPRALAPQPLAYESAVGESRSVTLPDGSIVTLDTDTRIVVDYREDQRQVRLERGAVFLDVTPDAQRPMQVQTAMGSVTVLGTQFQVRQDNDALRVVLVKGAVRLDADTAQTDTVAMVLRPGQQAWRTRSASWATADADLDSTAWRQGRLVFRSKPLAQAVAEVNRYTPHKLQLADPSLDALAISGVFRAGDPDSFVLVLQNTLPVQAQKGSDGHWSLQLSSRR